MFDDLAVANAHGVDGFELDFPARRLDPKNRALMGAVVGLEGCDDVVIDRLPVDLGMEIRKSLAQGMIKTARAFLVRRPARLRMWSWKSSAKSSSKRSKLPPDCTSSVLRRTIPFAASCWSDMG